MQCPALEFPAGILVLLMGSVCNLDSRRLCKVLLLLCGLALRATLVRQIGNGLGKEQVAQTLLEAPQFCLRLLSGYSHTHGFLCCAPLRH